ncbi:MAG TPA: hypothetical protein VNG69_07690 [Casimicrobiaceae bacterium]|nr:hypothetical protein [Casimicrobiaceae bacterium]
MRRAFTRAVVAASPAALAAVSVVDAAVPGAPEEGEAVLAVVVLAVVVPAAVPVVAGPADVDVALLGAAPVRFASALRLSPHAVSDNADATASASADR